MGPGLQEQLAFYLTGKSPNGRLSLIDEMTVRPALFAGFSDLTQLRYDFPLVLVDGAPADHTCVQSLSAIVDGLVQDVSESDNADQLAHLALQFEQHVRAAAANGQNDRLMTAWNDAAQELRSSGDDRLCERVEVVRAALKVNGELVDCGRSTPALFLAHIWSTVQHARLARVRVEIDRLVIQLTDILRVDTLNSEAGRSADQLKESVGTAHSDLFDFQEMSRLLERSSSTDSLSPSRRRRVEGLLDLLRSQRFFELSRNPGGDAGYVPSHSFVFNDCIRALAAYRRRFPEAIELAKAIAMAKLEVRTLYNEQRHDPLFAEFGASGLDSQEMARFPDYFVVTDASRLHGEERDALMQILSAGLPMNILIQSDDIVEEPEFAGNQHINVGSRARQITSAAVGLNEVFVLQASSSHLYQIRDRISDGLRGVHPALFSVFTGDNPHVSGLPPYLVAAAAMESRAFPAFVYDPGTGKTWIDRFSVDGNPQVDGDWPTHRITYQDANLQRVETNVTFTLADFLSCDRRFGRDFANVPQFASNGSTISIADCLDQDTDNVSEQIPSILMIDREDRLQRVIVDARVTAATRRCRDAWRSLRELGGVHNSHAERLLEEKQREWEAKAREATISTAPIALGTEPDGAALVEPVPAHHANDDEPDHGSDPERSPGEPYIETPRCTTCHECIQINDKLFAYNEDGQAYIADPDAGSFRELVEAAENCQVAIIHPGKPRNPDEPRIEDLIARAEVFQ